MASLWCVQDPQSLESRHCGVGIGVKYPFTANINNILFNSDVIFDSLGDFGHGTELVTQGTSDFRDVYFRWFYHVTSASARPIPVLA